MSRPTVVIYRPVDTTGRTARELVEDGCEVVDEALDLPGAVPSPRARGADVLLGATFRGGVMSSDFLAGFPQLRLVAKYTIGYDDVDIEAATALGVAVTHCPTEANWGGVAEGTIGLMLALLKRVRERDRHVKSGGWRDERLRGVYVGARADGHAGLTVGIVGLGRAGSRVAELLRPWRVRLVGCDPYVADARFAELDVERVALDDLLRAADVVTLHCNLTRETLGLIGARELDLMKPTAVLINTARGVIVELDALVAALESRALAGAALDVFPHEPLATDARVRALGDEILLSPHMVAANAGGTLAAAVPWALEAVHDALRGRLPRHIVNADVAPAWQARFGSIVPSTAERPGAGDRS